MKRKTRCAVNGCGQIARRTTGHLDPPIMLIDFCERHMEQYALGEKLAEAITACGKLAIHFSDIKARIKLDIPSIDRPVKHVVGK